MNRTRLVVITSALALALLASVRPAHADSFYVEEFVTGPTTPGKWGSPVIGTWSGVITWSLMPAGTDLSGEGAGTSSHLSSFMPGGFLAEIIAAFNAWEAVANIDFLQVGDSGTPFNSAGATGDIRIGGHAFDGPGGVLAHGFYPPVNGTSAAGDIHFDIAETWDIGQAGSGFDIFTVMAHEIGHALGLDHTGVANQLMNPTYSEAFLGLQFDDIAGAQFLYGTGEGDPEPVPEPGTLLLFGAGMAAVVRLRRRAH